MSDMIGMDVDAVGAAARQLDVQAAALQEAKARVALIVAELHHVWHGPDAATFHHWWVSQHEGELLKAHTALVGLAQSARNNVKDQETASSPVGRPVSDKVLEADRRSVEKAQKLTPDEQAKWWARQSPEDQQRLEMDDPEGLLMLAGLPAAVRPLINDAAAKDDAAHLAERSNSLDEEVKVDAGVAELTAGGTVTESQDVDGTYTVDVNGKLGIGKGIDAGGDGHVDVGAGAEVAQSYRFDSKQEADDFIRGLAKAVVPKPNVDTAIDFGLGGGASGLVVASSTQVASYLEPFRSHLESSTVAGRLTAAASVKTPDSSGDGPSAGLNVGANTAVSYDSVSRTTSATLGGSLGGSVDLGNGFNTSGEGDVTAQVSWDHAGHVQSVDLSGSASTSGGDAGPVSSGEQTTWSIHTDMQDPTNLALSHQLTQQMESGDEAGARRTLAQLAGRSEVVVQNDVVTSVGQDYSLGVVGVSGEDTSTVSTGIYVKPAGGTGVQIE